MDIKIKTKKIDILILGAGIAGLEAAYEASKTNNSIAVLYKGSTASDKVLGFNANVSEDDSIDKYFEDTIKGGGELPNKDVVKTLVEKSKAAVSQMEDLGLEFDKIADKEEKYSLLKPLGCSEARLVHSGNETGRRTIAILKKLLTAKGVLFWGDMMAGSLIKSEDKIAGAIALNKKEESIWVVYAKAVIVATGGGHLMDRSTYPISMTADGYAMAYRAGAKLVDMEFIQHEPCNAVFPKSLGISTTLLAKGGTLKNKKGERFVLNEYEGEYAVSKDSLSRMIALEIVQGRGTKHSGVYLDLTDLPEDEIKERHSLYYKRFLEAGIDISKEVVEVAPIAHSMMGGIEIAPNTSTEVPGLFASGEVTGGIHGANRVGGNAGTEIYVFGAIAGESAAKYADKNKKNKIDKQNASDILDMIDKRFEIADDQGDIDKYKEEIKNIMSKYMSPIREEKGLKTAIKELKNIGDSLNQVKFKTFADIYLWFEANNMQLVSELACRAALERQESRGVHFRTDYPNTDNENWKKNICFSDKKGMEIIDIK